MKTMKLAVLAMAIMGMTSAAYAQSNGKTDGKKAPSRTENIELKADRMAAQLGLDDSQAARFKEIYLRHAKEMNAQPKAANAKKAVKSDSEIDAEMKARLARQITMAEQQSKYYEELRTVLSARQAQRVMYGNRQRAAMRPQGRMQPRQGMQRPGMLRQGMQRQGMQRPGMPQMQRNPMRPTPKMMGKKDQDKKDQTKDKKQDKKQDKKDKD